MCSLATTASPPRMPGWLDSRMAPCWLAALTSEYQRPNSARELAFAFYPHEQRYTNPSLRRFHILCEERQHCTKRLRHLWVLQADRVSFWRKAVREHIEQVIEAHHTVEPVFNSLTR